LLRELRRTKDIVSGTHSIHRIHYNASISQFKIIVLAHKEVYKCYAQIVAGKFLQNDTSFEKIIIGIFLS